MVIAAIVLAVVLINRKGDEDERTEVKLDDILSGALQPKRFDGTWVDDTSYYYTDMSNVSKIYLQKFHLECPTPDFLKLI